jgi:hypothetical protein
LAPTMAVAATLDIKITRKLARALLRIKIT